MYKTVYIDMDNTLIATQALYEEARAELVSLIEDHSAVSRKEILHKLTQEEVSLFDQYGYGRHMLPHAYENTFLHFKKNAAEDEIEFVREIANDVYRKIAVPKEGAMEAVDLIARHMKICLVTVGDEVVQKRRISFLSCKDAFHRIFVVAKKDTDTYRQIMAETGTRPDQAVMVGDSLKSDIIPAVEAGMFGVFIPANNWVAREMIGVTLPEKGAVEIANIVDAAREICAKRVPVTSAAPKKFPKVSG